jgi:hypothetical protein
LIHFGLNVGKCKNVIIECIVVVVVKALTKGTSDNAFFLKVGGKFRNVFCY